MSRRQLIAAVAAVVFFGAIALEGQNLIDAATQLKGIVAIAHGGTGSGNPPGIATRVVTTSSSDPIVAADRLGCVEYQNTTSSTVTIAQANTTGFTSNFTACLIVDATAGPVTITPATSHVNGGSSFKLYGGMKARWRSDNTDYFIDTYSNRRVCVLSLGAADFALLPEKHGCPVEEDATLIELDVSADAGTPNIIVARNHAGTIANIVSGALATGSSGANACSAAVAQARPWATCVATLQNTSLAAGDALQLVSGSASSAAKMSVFAVFVVN